MRIFRVIVTPGCKLGFIVSPQAASATVRPTLA
jgi:hypothetical protein